MSVFLKIGAHKVKVTLKEFENDDDRCGDACYTEAEIRINKKLPATQRGASLIHEILHFANTTLDHVVLDSLAEQIYQALYDNELLDESRFDALFRGDEKISSK